MPLVFFHLCLPLFYLFSLFPFFIVSMYIPLFFLPSSCHPLLFIPSFFSFFSYLSVSLFIPSFSPPLIYSPFLSSCIPLHPSLLSSIFFSLLFIPSFFFHFSYLSTSLSLFHPFLPLLFILSFQFPSSRIPLPSSFSFLPPPFPLPPLFTPLSSLFDYFSFLLPPLDSLHLRPFTHPYFSVPSIIFTCLSFQPCFPSFLPSIFFFFSSICSFLFL